MDWERWICSDLGTGIKAARARNDIGVRVVLDPLSTYIRNDVELEASMNEHLQCIKEISTQKVNASMSVKLSALGMSFNREVCRSALLTLAEHASSSSIALEIDMEGRSSIDFAISCALMLAKNFSPPTLAIQAYLDRSPVDIEALQNKGIRIRLVKGAYQGDEEDVLRIQERMSALIDQLGASGKRYCLGTHDPILIDKVQRNNSLKGVVELGFLKGLAGESIPLLASKGWDVVEYIPFGEKFLPYIHRREVYLNRLISMGKTPIP